jgi:hypothetical protein
MSRKESPKSSDFAFLKRKKEMKEYPHLVADCYGPATNKWRITRQDKFY